MGRPEQSIGGATAATILTGACGLLDTIKQEWGESWSEFDQSIRDGLTSLLKAEYEPGNAAYRAVEVTEAPESAEAFAKQWLQDHQPEPLKCMNCGKSQSFGPINSGLAVYCEKAPKGTSGCVYEITIGGPDLTYVSHAACAEAYASRLRAILAETQQIANTQQNLKGLYLSQIEEIRIDNRGAAGYRGRTQTREPGVAELDQYLHQMTGEKK